MMTPLVAKLIWIVGVIGWYVIRYPYQRRSARLAIAKSTGGVRDRMLLIIAGLCQFALPLFYVVSGQPRIADYGFNPVQAWFGVLVLVAALVLFRITHKQLGRNWSISLETRQRHELVTEGVYAYVRHPMYSSFFLSALAQLALLPNWIAGPSGLVGIAILFFFRVGREEAMMIETFGSSYSDYMKRTARIIPWVY
jgi:protein-S-isoprenylcysteine O-methyltransferase Ste14